MGIWLLASPGSMASRSLLTADRASVDVNSCRLASTDDAVMSVASRAPPRACSASASFA